MILFLAILFGALTLFAVYQAITPFLENRDDQLRFELLDRELKQIETLSARKGRILQTLKDIEFDFETGKISEEDYEQLRRRHERKALKIMRQLDELREGDDDLLDDIDSEVAERLEQLREPTADESTRDSSADHAGDRSEQRPLECPSCGRGLETDARFCDRCGTEIDEEARRAAAESHQKHHEHRHSDRPPPDGTDTVTSDENEPDDLGIDIY